MQQNDLGFNGGFVVITAGRHKGKTGVWDDDDDHGAIVYLGNFSTGPYVTVRYSSLREATADEIKAFATEHTYWKGMAGL